MQIGVAAFALGNRLIRNEAYPCDPSRVREWCKADPCRVIIIADEDFTIVPNQVNDSRNRVTRYFSIVCCIAAYVTCIGQHPPATGSSVHYPFEAVSRQRGMEIFVNVRLWWPVEFYSDKKFGHIFSSAAERGNEDMGCSGR